MKIIEENCCSDASASVDFSMSVFSQRQLTDAQIQEWNIDVNRLSSQFAAFGNAFLGKKKQNERRMQSTAQSNHQRMAHESKQMASNDIFLYFRFITKLIHRLGWKASVMKSIFTGFSIRFLFIIISQFMAAHQCGLWVSVQAHAAPNTIRAKRKSERNIDNNFKLTLNG